VIVDLIDAETWTILGADVKGDAYEGLLEKNAQDTKSGVGQYFTPRALIQAMVDCIAPQPGERITDPACGTGGFLFTAHNYITNHNKSLTREQLKHLKEKAFTGYELVQATARVCAMNMMLHGIGSEKQVPVVVGDALAADPGERFELVLANPPFGKKSSTVIVGEDGRTSTEKDTIERDDFWATTSNKQLNFVQHIKTLLKPAMAARRSCCRTTCCLKAARVRPFAKSCCTSVMCTHF
jgi:type I restriction enzyme M protein